MLPIFCAQLFGLFGERPCGKDDGKALHPICLLIAGNDDVYTIFEGKRILLLKACVICLLELLVIDFDLHFELFEGIPVLFGLADRISHDEQF
jgi:hypothetical protein